MLFLYSVKSLDKIILSESIFENKYVNISAIIGLLSLVASVYFPPLQFLLDTVSLTATDWLMAIGVSVFGAIMIEVVKLIIHNEPKQAQKN
jgi:uncharacterized membrane protein